MDKLLFFYYNSHERAIKPIATRPILVPHFFKNSFVPDLFSPEEYCSFPIIISLILLDNSTYAGILSLDSHCDPPAGGEAIPSVIMYEIAASLRSSQ